MLLECGLFFSVLLAFIYLWFFLERLENSSFSAAINSSPLSPLTLSLSNTSTCFLNTFRDSDSTTSLCRLVQCPTTLVEKKFFLIYNLLVEKVTWCLAKVPRASHPSVSWLSWSEKPTILSFWWTRASVWRIDGLSWDTQKENGGCGCGSLHGAGNWAVGWGQWGNQWATSTRDSRSPCPPRPYD